MALLPSVEVVLLDLKDNLLHLDILKWPCEMRGHLLLVQFRILHFNVPHLRMHQQSSDD